MKRLLVVLIALLFVSTSMLTQAQENKGTVKKEIKETKNELKTQKKELKAERKELKIEKSELRKLEGNNVNPISKNSFISDFGNIPNVKWSRTSYFDEARFVKDGKNITAYYDIDGKLVGSSQHVTFGDVPAAGQKYIKNKYKDYKIGTVIFYDDNEINTTNFMLYGLEFNDEDSYFVELSKENKRIVLRVNSDGLVYFFKEL